MTAMVRLGMIATLTLIVPGSARTLNATEVEGLVVRCNSILPLLQVYIAFLLQPRHFSLVLMQHYVFDLIRFWLWLWLWPDLGLDLGLGLRLRLPLFKRVESLLILGNQRDDTGC